MEDEHNQDHELGGTKEPKTMKRMNIDQDHEPGGTKG